MTKLDAMAMANGDDTVKMTGAVFIQPWPFPQTATRPGLTMAEDGEPMISEPMVTVPARKLSEMARHCADARKVLNYVRDFAVADPKSHAKVKAALLSIGMTLEEMEKKGAKDDGFAPEK